MGGRRYRVVERLHWIEGGRPGLSEGEWKWEGGEAVVYEPDDTVYVDDRELTTSLSHKLEGLDDAGRAALEEIRVSAEGPAKRTLVADIPPEFVEELDRALDEKRAAYWEDYAVLRDGSVVPLPTQYVPINPLPGVVYGDNGLPDSWATARQREQLEKDSKLARIHSGASLGGRRGRETKRDQTARSNEALLTAVREHRAKQPSHGRPTIAEALVDKFGSIRDHADPRGRKKAIEALRKRIDRLERSLDK